MRRDEEYNIFEYFAEAVKQHSTGINGDKAENRIYTEFRISHKTLEEKQKFEKS
ncbi:hypothetical protein [Clostridium botulinum]|uniref:Uncharacterized protein n=1 Tax=Clostridium botulinum TaxID=1491 RepID=A0A1L7JNE1_CLOBO|nr:hypothetical protein [Clostridium botulinum]APU87290.1 hypothetical protein NPD8_4073 [Clostridium botulinum]